MSSAARNAYKWTCSRPGMLILSYTRDDHFKELEDEKFDIRNAFADKPDRMAPRASGPNGYGGGYGGGGGGYGDRQQDNGYGSRNKTDGGAGGNADAWGSGGGAGGGGAQGWDNAVDSYGSGGGYGGAGGGYGGAGGGADDGCRICKDPGHWVRLSLSAEEVSFTRIES